MLPMVQVGDDYFIEVPHMVGYQFPTDTLFRVVPTEYSYTPNAKDSVVVKVVVESVPRPADRPVSAKGYAENGYQRVAIDMPLRMAMALRQFLGQIGGGVSSDVFVTNPSRFKDIRTRATTPIYLALGDIDEHEDA